MSNVSNNSEVKIIVEGETIMCQKDVLMAGSEYFRAMFSSQMIESRSQEVTLQDQKAELVNAIIECINTGELMLGDNVQALTELAVMLQVPAAISTCTAYLKQRLRHTNCLGFMLMADSLALHNLYNVARRHALYFFTKVYTKREFLSLSTHDLTAYLSDKHLNCVSEKNVVDAINVWYHHDVEERRQDLAMVLQCIHVEDLTAGEWEVMVKVAVLADTAAGQTWVKDNENKKDAEQDGQYRSLPVCFLTIGGIIDGGGHDDACMDIYKLAHGETKFKPFKSLSEIFPQMEDKMGFQVSVSGKNIYITGGQPILVKQRYEMNVWRLDGFSWHWDVVTQLPSPRRHHGACASSTDLYVMGGFGRYRIRLDTAQQYSLVTDKWTDLPAMPQPGYSIEAIFHSDKIYAYGDSIICYDSKTRHWTTIHTFTTGFRYLPVSFDRYIYMFPLFHLPEAMIEDLPSTPTSPPSSLFCKRYDTVTGKKLDITGSDSKVGFGNRVVIANKKFYTLQKFDEDNTFVCGQIDDFSKYSVISDKPIPPRMVFLISVPDYPAYR